MAEKPLQSLTIQGLSGTYVNTPLSTAPTFVTTQNYAVNDCVFYNRKLYKFVTAHSAGAWDNSHVQEITIADELSDVRSDLSQKYEKPTSGIPASDLASGVIPDVSGFYTKPSGGIPDSDLSSGVQTSLGKADTAYQKPSGGIPLTDLASNVQNISGTTPSITGVSGMRYICGEVSTLSITPPASGDMEVIFESGSTATVLTVPNTVKFPAWFDPTDLESDCTYDIIITNGTLGVVTSWA